MLIQKEFLKKIKDFGLNSYEAKIWTALLSRGVSTAGELSDIANVPRSRSYDVLESLEKKGFVVMKIGKPIKYIAIPPQEVLSRVKKKIQEDSNYQMKMLDELKSSDILQELNTLHTEGVSLVEPTDITASFRGRDRLYSHIELMIKEAETSIIIMTTEDGIIRKLDALSRVLEKAHTRGVKIMIAAPVTDKTKVVLNKAKKYAEIKDCQTKGRFCIVDEKEITFMLLNDNEVHSSYDVGVWVNTSFFSQTLIELFNLAWKTMKVFA
ncbi:TrmB family transcriptional regulator [archaeon]|nr:TrmB family transcriptional regulator [archaeon]MBL7056693.1 TrmB family transcriptional regulator [Candidatus Woesearchaeota archaeon]